MVSQDPGAAVPRTLERDYINLQAFTPTSSELRLAVMVHDPDATSTHHATNCGSLRRVIHATSRGAD